MDRMRASDAEREACVGVLRTAAHEGRLDTDELEERVAAAYAAKTRGELTALLDDIPAAETLPAQAPSTRAPRRKPPRVPGRIGFTERWRAPVQRPEAMHDALEFIAPPLQTHGYDLVERTSDRLVFRRRSRPAWTILVAILAFPIGLLALLYEVNETIAIEFVARGEETSVVAHGTAPLRVRKAFALLEP